MKLKIEKADLLSALGVVSKAVGTGGTMPILGCVLLEVSENGLQLTGNDLEMAIQTPVINACVDEPGSAALDAKLFSEIIKKLPDEEISISVGKDYNTEIKCGKSVFKIAGDNPEGFPNVPDVSRELGLTIRESVLHEMIKQTIISVSSDESKPAFTGELLKAEDGGISLVTIDGFRVSYRRHQIDAPENPVEAIIPGKTMGDLVKLLNNVDDKDAVIYFTDKHALFALESCTVVTRLIEGRFMDYKSLFTTDHTSLIKADRSALLMSLERACLVADDARKTPIVLNITKGAMTVTSTAQRGSSREELEVWTEGDGLEISFNPRYLIEALKVVPDDEIAIQFSGSVQPCIIKPVDDGDYKFLILPLRIGK